MRFAIPVCIAAALLLSGCMGAGAPSAPTRAAPVPASLVPSGEVETIVNAERMAAGLAPLQRSAQLDRAALAHARDQAGGGFFGHTGSDGSTVHRRLTATGYDSCLSAENIAMGQESAAAVMGDWMQSSGHRRNILHPRAEQFGFARAGGHWVMVLARPC